MAAADKKIQPIIVKKVKKGGHGHHGGAWKIAYADFVTAMMAFFLLMWLLGSTAKGDLNGISEVFNTPLKVAMMGGSGAGDSSSIIKGGGQDLTRSNGNVKRGDVRPDKSTKNPHSMANDNKRLEGERLKALKQKVELKLDNSPKLSELKDQIRIDLIPEGLRIQIVDDQQRPMFDTASAVVQDYMRDLLQSIGDVLNEVKNPVSLSGHTDARPFSTRQRSYSNWELSAERANASRRELIAGGLDESKVIRVVGMASALPLDRADPRAAINRRIAIVVLTEEATQAILQNPALNDTDTAEQASIGESDGATQDTGRFNRSGLGYDVVDVDR